jgi:2-amino-4-hydroxy-6-hydroxymethyldihydropteridine diphosphokinase
MNGQMAGAVPVFLGLGSNQGDRLAHLRDAVASLMAHPRLSVTACSRIWETEHVGPDVQDPYLNACVAVATDLPPLELLDTLKGLEAAAGRQPDGHRRPRPIDLDILLYGEQVIREGRLTVPHPQWRERAFVLEPLAEIAGARPCPESNETIGQVCAKIRRKGGPWVRPYDGEALCGGQGLNDEGVLPGQDQAREQGGRGCYPGATSSSKA